MFFTNQKNSKEDFCFCGGLGEGSYHANVRSFLKASGPPRTFGKRGTLFILINSVCESFYRDTLLSDNGETCALLGLSYK